MSFKAFVWAWEQEIPSGDHLLVLLAIANIAKAREIRASVPYIAKMVRKSPRKVRSAISWLSDAGLIAVTERPGRVDLIRMMIPASFTVTMDDEENEDLENGARGRPRKTPAQNENPYPEVAKPLANPCPRGADEPIEPDEPKRATDVALSAASADRSEARRAFDAFNAMVEGWNEKLPMKPPRSLALKLTDSRRGHLNARLKEVGGLDGWLEALLRAERSPFLSGCTRHRFSISLDFLLQPSSFTKLMEGFYDGQRQNGHDAAGFASGGGSIRQERNSAMFAGAAAALDRRGSERGRFGG